MVQHGNQHCNENTINTQGIWEGGVWYYDGERVYYQIANYTGNTSWNACAGFVEAMYRDSYVLPNNGAVPGYRIFSHGLYQDYVRTGDASSKNAAILLSKNAASTPGKTPLAWIILHDSSREIAYNIEASLIAEQLGEPHNPYLDTYIEIALGHIDQWVISQDASYVRPFMVGLTAEALIQYYETRSQDPRIPPVIKTAMDWLWDNTWVPSAQSFQYTDRPTDTGGTESAPDLNLLIAPAYAWVYRQTGNATYIDRGDQIFAGGVQGSWLDGGKQYSQSYRWSFDYLKWRNST